MRPLIVALALLVGACAYQPPKPLVDLKSVSDPVAYQKDLVECVTLADYFIATEEQSTMKMLQGAAIGGAGAGIGTAVMGNPAMLGTDIAGGAIGGVITSALDTEADRRYYANKGVGRCLEGRGYTIMNARAIGLLPIQWCTGVLIKMHGLYGVDDNELQRCVAMEEARRPPQR